MEYSPYLAHFKDYVAEAFWDLQENAWGDDSETYGGNVCRPVECLREKWDLSVHIRETPIWILQNTWRRWLGDGVTSTYTSIFELLCFLKSHMTIQTRNNCDISITYINISVSHPAHILHNNEAKVGIQN